MPEKSARPDSRLYRKREPFMLALLSGLAVLLFLVVTGLARMFHAQQQSLANRWSARGAADLHAERFRDAVVDFRTALLYSRDNYSYQLSLAEALLGEGRTDEAKAYLISLWSRQPEDGFVNLELARIASRQGETEKALRYYHNAIYATWPGDLEIERRNTRLELVDFLLHIDAKAQARSELIALAANLGDEPAEQVHVGDLFVQALDFQQALAEYSLSMKDGQRPPGALAGAGRAAFELGQYSLAEKYLQQAVAAAPGDTASAARLKSAELVLQLDPFQQQIPVAERDQIVVAAFTAAGGRLNFCHAFDSSSAPQLAALAQDWSNLKPEMNKEHLRRNPDRINAAMALVFNVERKTGGACGASTGTDTALLLIANLHEGL